MPYVMLKFGVVFGFIILFLLYMLTLMTLRLLLLVRRLVKLEDYYKIALKTYN